MLTLYTVSTVINNIPELLTSRKTNDYAIILIMTLLGVMSFGLGRLSSTNTNQASVLLCESEYVPNTIMQTSSTHTSSEKINNISGQYVASKNGTIYHLPWCSGAKRIKEENKVWFTEKSEAEKAGYRPATNCKGI